MLSLAACAGPAPSSAAPATSSASAEVFVADLVAVVSAVDPEASCRGKVTIAFDPIRRPPLNRITATFELALSGCPASTRIADADVHAGAAGVAGAARFDAALKGLDLVNGSGTVTTRNAGVDPRALEDISADPAGFYFHVHSERHPVGLLRGQLRRGG